MSTLKEVLTITSTPSVNGSIPSISFSKVERIRSCTTSFPAGPDPPPEAEDAPPPELDPPRDLAPTSASSSSKKRMQGEEERAFLKRSLKSRSDSPTKQE